MVTFSGFHYALLSPSLGVSEPKDFFGLPARAPQDEACGLGLVFALDLPESWHPDYC